MKEGRQLAEEDLGKVLSEGQMARWRILKEKVALEKGCLIAANDSLQC